MQTLTDLPCRDLNDEDEPDGDPLNLIIVGSGQVVLSALLRGHWDETSADEAIDRKAHFLFGRKQNAIFRYQSFDGASFYELRGWLAPFTFEGTPIWICQVRRFYRYGALQRLDPDVDNARNCSSQNLLYAQALKRVAFVAGERTAPAETFWEQVFGNPWFSDGTRAIAWISDEPQAIQDLEFLVWGELPV